MGAVGAQASAPAPELSRSNQDQQVDVKALVDQRLETLNIEDMVSKKVAGFAENQLSELIKQQIGGSLKGDLIKKQVEESIAQKERELKQQIDEALAQAKVAGASAQGELIRQQVDEALEQRKKEKEKERGSIAKSELIRQQVDEALEQRKKEKK